MIPSNKPREQEASFTFAVDKNQVLQHLVFLTPTWNLILFELPFCALSNPKRRICPYTFGTELNFKFGNIAISRSLVLQLLLFWKLTLTLVLPRIHLTQWVTTSTHTVILSLSRVLSSASIRMLHNLQQLVWPHIYNSPFSPQPHPVMHLDLYKKTPSTNTQWYLHLKQKACKPFSVFKDD